MLLEDEGSCILPCEAHTSYLFRISTHQRRSNGGLNTVNSVFVKSRTTASRSAFIRVNNCIYLLSDKKSSYFSCKTSDNLTEKSINVNLSSKSFTIRSSVWATYRFWNILCTEQRTGHKWFQGEMSFQWTSTHTFSKIWNVPTGCTCMLGIKLNQCNC